VTYIVGFQLSRFLLWAHDASWNVGGGVHFLAGVVKEGCWKKLCLGLGYLSLAL